MTETDSNIIDINKRRKFTELESNLVDTLQDEFETFLADKSQNEMILFVDKPNENVNTLEFAAGTGLYKRELDQDTYSSITRVFLLKNDHKPNAIVKPENRYRSGKDEVLSVRYETLNPKFEFISTARFHRGEEMPYERRWVARKKPMPVFGQINLAKSA